MCSNLNSVLDSIGLASNVFLLLEWVSISILSSHAHLPLSTYSIRDYIKKRGADVEQSRKISLRAALARQGCSCPSGLGRPGTVFWLPRSPSPLLVRHGASWAESWYHHPGVNELFNKRWHNSTRSPFIRGWRLSLTNTSHRRELTAGAGLVQRQQLCLYKPLFSPRAAVHLIAASWGSVGHFKPLAAAV